MTPADLAKFPLLADLSQAEREAVAEEFESREFAAGASLFREGDHADGALAVLLLLTGPLSQAVESIGLIAAEMRRIPRSRVFYLLLLEKGQRVAPEDLRENISLLDESSLFLVPQEKDGKAGILLREMFGRILP